MIKTWLVRYNSLLTLPQLMRPLLLHGLSTCSTENFLKLPPAWTDLTSFMAWIRSLQGSRFLEVKKTSQHCLSVLPSPRVQRRNGHVSLVDARHHFAAMKNSLLCMSLVCLNPPVFVFHCWRCVKVPQCRLHFLYQCFCKEWASFVL